MQVEQVIANNHVVRMNSGIALFSYNKLLAFRVDDYTVYYVKPVSKTSEKHLRSFIGRDTIAMMKPANEVSQMFNDAVQNDNDPIEDQDGVVYRTIHIISADDFRYWTVEKLQKRCKAGDMLPIDSSGNCVLRLSGLPMIAYKD